MPPTASSSAAERRRSRRGRSSLVVATLVVAALCWLFSLLLSTYRFAYRESRERAISRDLARLREGDDDDDEGESGGNGEGGDGDSAASRLRRIVRMRERMGIGVDSLPRVRFGGVRDDGESVANGDEIRRIRAERERLERRAACLTHGAFVSSTDEFVDCRVYCGVSDGVTYRYYDRLGSLLNGRMSRTGGYCLPTDAAACNPATSVTVYSGALAAIGGGGGGGGNDDDSRGDWRCLPITRAFAGEGGNRVVACYGSLLDRATGRVWRDRIDPSGLTFDSVDELLPNCEPSDDSPYGHCRRFVCPPDERDARGNRSVAAPFDRLFSLANACAALIPHAAPEIGPNFAESACDCGEFARYDESSGVCLPLANGGEGGGGGDGSSEDAFDDRRLLTLLRRRTENWVEEEEEAKKETKETTRNDDDATAVPPSPWTLSWVSATCVEPWMTLSQAENLARVSSSPTKGSESSGAANVGYARTYAAVFDRLVPSDAAVSLTRTR